MVITILEAKLSPEQTEKLRVLYRQAKAEAPPGFVSYLLNNQSDRSVWRIVTVWKSQAELDTMLASVKVPRGKAMFLKVGAEPTLTIWDVPEWIG
ncbi:MAG: antibiotic biosynthesis monooxygenase [Candidatus Kerfeldbacteria bacterium]|nr:antibiotic biosynthesis monooxygenase [Candidatus Kerfeldbacteria bacterium]